MNLMRRSNLYWCRGRESNPHPLPVLSGTLNGITLRHLRFGSRGRFDYYARNHEQVFLLPSRSVTDVLHDLGRANFNSARIHFQSSTSYFRKTGGSRRVSASYAALICRPDYWRESSCCPRDSEDSLTGNRISAKIHAILHSTGSEYIERQTSRPRIRILVAPSKSVAKQTRTVQQTL